MSCAAGLARSGVEACRSEGVAV